jgi:hypothetical protein
MKSITGRSDGSARLFLVKREGPRGMAGLKFRVSGMKKQAGA